MVEDEEDRHGREPDRLERRPRGGDPARPIGEEAREGENEEELAELGGLEAEEADVDPPLRPARERRGEEDEHHQRDRPGIDHAVVAAVDGRGDEERAGGAHDPDRGEDRLARHVVARAAGHVVPRDAGDRPEPVCDQAADRHDEYPVEAARERRRLGAGGPTGTGGGAVAGVLDHQSECTAPCCVAWRPKYCSNTFSAAGAAAVPPWPPFSITAQTTIVGFSVGP